MCSQIIKQVRSSTFSQIYIQIVFAVKGRASLVSKSWEEELYKFVSGIVTNKGQKLLAINGMPDHVHALFMLNPNVSLAKIIQQVKGSTSYFINKNNIIPEYFKWQDGFWAKALGDDAVKIVHSYIRHQKRRHCKQLRYQ